MSRNVARGAALLVTALAAWWFALHPQPLLLGTTVQETVVPWWYQAAAFPPFVLLVAGLQKREARLARVVLLAGVSAVALVRVAGLIPLSGHGMFLAAALVFTARERDERDVFFSSLAALALTVLYKSLWHDLVFFSMSVALGAAWGALSRRLRVTS